MEARERSGQSILIKNMDLGGPEMNVPDDVIVDILSRLPIKYILRFKCVCKSWLMITQQKFFIEKHLSLSQSVYESKQTYANNYFCGDSINGLVLERNCETNLHRIRNPATKQVLQVTSEVFKKSFRYMIGFDPSTSMYKLIHFYFKEGQDSNISVRMLTIGSDDDHSWRYLDDVNLVWSNWRTPRHRYHNNVNYSATYSYLELEKTDILRLPMDGKSSMNIKVPQDFQTVRGIKYSYGLQMFILGDEKLSLGFIIGNNLHVWVLENYKKHIWSEEKIIPLDFMKDYPDLVYITVQPSPNLGKLRATLDNHYVEYDVHSKTYIFLAKLPPRKRFVYNITPSLVSLKGMRPESEDSTPSNVFPL